jgi:uncharacterized protein YggE
MRNKLLLAIAGLLVIGSLAACTAGAPVAQAQAPTQTAQSNQRTIAVTGEGKVTLVPDIAYINIGVQTENPNAVTAVADNTTQSQKVMDAIKKIGVASKDIQTTDYSIFPRQNTDQQGKITGTTYVVNNTVHVTLRDLSKIGSLLDQAAAAGANNVNGIQFDVADRNPAMSQARQLAVQDATTQAQELAKAAGVTLGPVQSITTQVSTPQPVIYGAGAAPSAAAANIPVSAGQLTITVDVNVVYAIQ